MLNSATWTLFGYTFYLVSQFGVISALAKITNPAEVGLFSLVLAIATPIIMLTNLGMRVGLATDVKLEYSLSEYAALRLFGSAAAVILISISGLVFFDMKENGFLFAVISLGKIAETYSDLCYGQYQKNRRMDLLAKSLLLRGPATFFLFTAILLITRKAEFAFSAQLVVWTVIAFFYDQRRMLQLSGEAILPAWRVDIGNIIKLFKVIYPLGIAALFAALANNVPRVIVERILGLENLGYFSAFSYVLTAGLFFGNAVGAVFLPRMADAWISNEKRKYWRLFSVAILFSLFALVIGVIFGLVAGKEFLELAFSREYAPFHMEFTVILAAVGLRFCSISMQTALSAQRRFSRLGIVQSFALALTIASGVYGALFFGLFGLSVSLLFVSAVQCLILAAYLFASRLYDGK